MKTARKKKTEMSTETLFLWLVHKRRLLQIVSTLKPTWPKPRCDRLDPYAIRSLFTILLVVSFLYAGSDWWYRIRSAFVFDHAITEGKKETQLDEETKRDKETKKREEKINKKAEEFKRSAEARQKEKDAVRAAQEQLKEAQDSNKGTNEKRQAQQQLKEAQEAFEKGQKDAIPGPGQADNDGKRPDQKFTAGKGQDNPNGLDPLGRPAAGRSFDSGKSQNQLPSKIEDQYVREILETLRNKLSNPNLSQVEREYIERLLK